MTITQLLIHRKDLVEYFKKIPDAQLIDAFISAMEVGTFCLERANAAQDLDFVRRQVDSLIGIVGTLGTAGPTNHRYPRRDNRFPLTPMPQNG